MGVTVAVLAGGRSRRMGAPKALARLGGAPLIARPLAAAQAAGLPAIVVAKPDSPLPELDVPVIHEPPEPRHPLCGLVAALEHVAAGCADGLCGEAELAAGAVVAVACDQPWVTGAVLAALAGRAEPVAVPLVAGRLEPFPGRYDARVLAALRAALAEEASLRATLAALETATVDLRPFGDPARLVASVNTPDELAAAQ
jgi:molybdopterin-guanine dinucleotide biosynthesis protein A